MTKIYLLTDYKGRFGSKHFDKPYRSGMDRNSLKSNFAKHGFEIEFLKFSEAYSIASDEFPTLYTSSEDNGYYYKSYIEDLICALENRGTNIIPAYKFLRANNNKVFMELLRDSLLPEKYKSIEVHTFGAIEELNHFLTNNKVKFPLVIKTSEGATGSGVYKADNISQLFKIVKKISRTKSFKFELRDWLRALKHENYIKDSKHRKKFILQEFIPDLVNDWKVYIFGDKLYIFKRPVFKHRGFRASGGGYDNYFYDREANAPEGLFDFAQEIINILKVPHASLDIAFDGTNFYLFEFQILYFGTAGIPYSKGYFTKSNGQWKFIEKKLSIEQVYVEGIVQFIEASK